MHEPWTKAELKSAQKILGRHTELDPALAEIGKAVRPVKAGALRCAFQTAGLGAPSSFFRHLDPVARAVAVETESQTKRENRELVAKLQASEARERLADSLRRYNIKPIKPRELRSGKRNMTAVVLASDWHVEEDVSLVKTAGFNASNLAASDVKQSRFFSGTRWLLDHERADKTFSIRDLVLWLGGDFMTGSIHDDPKRELTPLMTMRWLTQRIVTGINQLLLDPLLETITIPCSFGNHDRTTKQAHFATGAENSYAWIMYQDLADRFAHERRVQFLADQSEFQYVQVYDKTLMFHHGHRINYGGGVGGIVIPVRKAMAQWVKVKHFDFAHHGHFHTYYDFENVTGNGSLIGYNEFAMGIKATPEKPAQAFYLLDSKRGKCCKTPVWVSE